MLGDSPIFSIAMSISLVFDDDRLASRLISHFTKNRVTNCGLAIYGVEMNLKEQMVWSLVPKVQAREARISCQGSDPGDQQLSGSPRCAMSFSEYRPLLQAYLRATRLHPHPLNGDGVHYSCYLY
ncbi:hypothetical protein MLD38_038060 [Melastoma candidum]|uniref:Uncharacterized protein n=1 Tax=Melastoma candidum TaxID=119954 RepID=A0ACB9KXU4_9MYRT|nr:hypothetical protein MLD38_038060 [Melastoma candidum]